MQLIKAALDSKIEDPKALSSVKVRIDGNDYTLCTLDAVSTRQQQLEIYADMDEELTYFVTGPNTVSLTGNFVEYEGDHLMEDDMDSMDEEDMEDMDEEDMEDMDEDEEMGSEESDDDDEPRFREIEAEEGSQEEENEESGEEEESEEEQEMPAKRTTSQQKEQPTKKQKQDASKQKESPVKQAEKKQPAQEKTKAKQEPKQEPKKSEAKNENKPEQKPASKLTKLPSGVEIENVKEGAPNTKVVKNGRKVGIYYVGKLANGKTFDSCSTGKPFSFTVGKGEVIKGLELGIQGMRVDSERKIVIPSNLGYGSAGAPPNIPKNADLTFEVKVVSIN